MKKTGIVFLLISFIFVACKKEPSGRQTIETEEISFTKNGELQFLDSEGEPLKQIDIEVARTEYEQETGLMYRKHMAENQGMLFVYDDEKPRPYFYMKNTYISLDLIYIDAAHKIVDINERAQPLDETTLPSEAPAQYVLEINGGMVEKWGLKIGAQVEFELR